MHSKTWFRVFIIIALVYLAASLFSDDMQFNFFLKPLLLLPLILVGITDKRLRLRHYLIMALVFCWLGDVLLLFAGNSEIFFILGLVSFLIGHLFYIVLFSKIIKNAGGSLKLDLLPALGVLVYLVAFLWLLGSHLGGLLVPVIIYALVIGTMFYFSILAGRTFISRNVGNLLIIGALSFVVSDSILAFNKFYASIPFASFMIMSTYIFAQGAIVWSYYQANTKKISNE